MAKLYIKNTDGTFIQHPSIAVTNLDIVQSKGDSMTSAMSQKAVTDELANKQNALTDTDGSYGQRVANLEKEGIASQEKLTELASKTIFIDEDVVFDKVGYYDKNHNIALNTSAQNTGFILIEGYVRVSCQTYLNVVGYAIAFIDDEMNFIGGILGNDIEGYNYESDVPSNAKYVIFSNYGSGPKSAKIYAGETLSKRVSALEEDVISKSTAVLYINPSGNQFDKSKVIVGKEVYVDGSLRNNSQSAASDYIDVGEQKAVYVNNLPIYEGYNRYCAFYSSDKTFISLKTLSASSSKGILTVPTNAQYFRFSLYQRWESGSKEYDNVMVSFGEYKDYEPFAEYLSSIGGFNIPKLDLNSLSLATLGKKALIFGDSITETATISDDGATYKEGTRVNWPTFALSMLGISEFRNYGKSGATYKDTSGGQYRQNVSEQIEMAIVDSYNDDADIVVMSLGTNDGAANIGSYETAMSKTTLNSLDKTNLYEALRWSMWTLRQKYMNATFFVGLPIQRASGEQPSAMLNAIVEMAKRYDFIVIDATGESGIIRDFETSGSAGRYLYDGLHPNEDGSKKLGSLYANEILSKFIL